MASRPVAFLQLTRVLHGFFYAVAVWVGMAIEAHGLPPLSAILLGGATAVLIEGGAFALNDYYDLEVDRANRRTDRPLVRGDLSPRTAMWAAAVMVPLGVLAAALINPACLFIAAMMAAASVLYDARMKAWGFAGNVYIGFTMAVPFLFGGAAVAGLPSALLALLASTAMVVGVGREIMKGIMDAEGDALRGVRTLARTWGARRARWAAVAFYLAAVAMSPLPFFSPLDPAFLGDAAYAVPVVATDALLVYTCTRLARDWSFDAVNRLRRVTMAALFLGLLAYLGAALV